MPLRVTRAEKADIPQLVDLYFSTFNSALVLKIKPDVPPVRGWFEKNLRSDMELPHTHVYKVEDSEAGPTHSTGETIAFAKWTSPHTEDTHGGPAEWPSEGDAALFEEVVGKAAEKKKTLLGQEEHWYLGVLATLPKHQRRGAGSLLMAEFCKQADQSGLRSYVEASPLGKSTYERFAFETQDTFEVTIDGQPYVDNCMVREPQRSS
ncbi:acyl-CoA N-acyltransferase [Truncatella angustata]|uniref:Acyl-CoA N-acyltransferase n=1 Tax=Truncatella angustata TaxID=152316 RepID=A0A9P8UL27_9PEZI|nr:acyl-CoA N-acyltransferase [Truncatella angustata]KAH6654146.1 acyl-CoA N-acyltransferase [Truncatella angustata]